MWLEHWNHVPTTVGWIMDAANMNKTDFYEKKSTMIYWPVKPKGGWSFPEGNNYTISSKLPVFEVGGWFDIFTRGTCNYYQYGLSKHATTDKKMIIGEWYHLSGAAAMGLNSVVMGGLPARWFDWKIKKKDDPFMEEFPVLLYVMGENKWRAEKSWPLPESRVDHKTLYLTKHAPTPIDGDWYTDDQTALKIYKNNNFGLSEYPGLHRRQPGAESRRVFGDPGSEPAWRQFAFERALAHGHVSDDFRHIEILPGPEYRRRTSGTTTSATTRRNASPSPPSRSTKTWRSPAP